MLTVDHMHLQAYIFLWRAYIAKCFFRDELYIHGCLCNLLQQPPQMHAQHHHPHATLISPQTSAVPVYLPNCAQHYALFYAWTKSCWIKSCCQVVMKCGRWVVWVTASSEVVPIIWCNSVFMIIYFYCYHYSYAIIHISQTYAHDHSANEWICLPVQQVFFAIVCQGPKEGQAYD